MIRVKWATYRLFDYERNLGRREVQSLLGASISEDDEAILETDHWRPTRVLDAVRSLTDRSTYFHTIDHDRYGPSVTRQAEAEAIHWRSRQASRKRQATRFGVHGIHEYRGKFNPQMARALINIVAPEATHLLDPFCGSGTTLVEGMRLGLDVAGIDQSPMAHYLARVKTSALSVPPAELASQFVELTARVTSALKSGQDDANHSPPDGFDHTSVRYLEKWFTSPALSAIFAALTVLDAEQPAVALDLTRLALSAIMRDVSLQLPEDLRVRRRPRGFVAPSLAESFRDQVDRFLCSIDELAECGPSHQDVNVLLGSASDRPLIEEVARGAGMHRVIVTSPPYATALPYIDTDRLSLVSLGLAKPSHLRQLESSLVGSREWSTRESRIWEAALEENREALPTSVLRLVHLIRKQNSTYGAGFRRAAVPTLLYRYFSQMAHCFDAWHAYLRPGECAVLVVGRNRTGAKGSMIEIATPQLLGDVAESRGYSVLEILPFQTWPRYGLHASNGVTGEDALVLRSEL